MLSKEVKTMLNQTCPKCHSINNIISYMPHVVGESIEIELECENCGQYAVIRCKGILESEYDGE